MPTILRRPLTLYLLFASCFFGTLSLFWLSQPPSGQELWANAAKAIDYFESMRAEDGWPWWTASFNMGQSLADSVTTFWPYLALDLGYLAGGESFILPWAKLVGLAGIFLGGLGLFFYVREITREAIEQSNGLVSNLNKLRVERVHEWGALAAALFYIVSPQMALRLATSEHLVVALCWAFPPWIFLSLHRLARRASFKETLLLALSLAAMTLTYVRTAVAFLPLVTVYALWLLVEQPREQRRRFILSLVLAALAYSMLALLPMLPFLRESQWMAFFEFDPLREWQKSFSFKTALSWIDRCGFATQGMPETFRVDQGGFYLGIVPLGALIFWLCQYGRHGKPMGSIPENRIIRFFSGLALFSIWLACGPKSILASHFEFLSQAQYAADWTIPVAWLGLLASCWFIYMLLPKTGWRPWLGACLIAVYLFLPGVACLQLIPLYKNLRAPWAFWEVGGTFAWAIAAGLALTMLLRERIRTPNMRAIAIISIMALGLLDWSGYGRAFARGGLSEQLWQDWTQVQEALRTDHRPGRVSVISSRYFYLSLPHATGRNLYAEAFHAHFALRWTRAMSLPASSSPDLLRLHLALMGVSHVLIDKADTADAEEGAWRELLPVVFENEHFALLANEAALSPFFLGQEWIAVSDDPGIWPLEFLWLLKYNYILIANPKEAYPSCAGQIDRSGQLALAEVNQRKSAPPLQVYNQPIPRKNESEIVIPSLPVNGGWVVVPEAYHPDWKAYHEGGRRLDVERAFGGLMAVFVPAGTRSLTLRFEEPGWYNLCMNMALGSWLVLSGLWSALCLRRKVICLDSDDVSAGKSADSLGGRIQRAVVMIPTYNERENILQQIDALLQADARLDLLIVDDGSPDGTADAVKRHPSYGERVQVLSRGGKFGYASACRDGMSHALESARKYDAFLTMDADGSHDAVDVPRLLAALETGADVAIGSRYVQGARVRNWPLSRLLLSRIGGMYARTLLCLPVADPTSGFKAARRSAIRAFLKEPWCSKGYIYHIEMIVFLLKKHYSILEIPITFGQRRKGCSKLSWAIVLEAAWRVLALLGRRF